MKNLKVINYHITNNCNYNCSYCFGKFNCNQNLQITEAKKIIDNFFSFFKENKVTDGRINFAGGEPTLYPHLDELIDYTTSLGLSTSIVTNGFLLSRDRIKSWQGKVKIIGLSIDSIQKDTNIKIGRSSQNIVLDLNHWQNVSTAIHESNIKLKINTVVSKFNLNEDLTPLYLSTNPNRIKLFQVHIVKGVNEHINNASISKDEFLNYCEKYDKFSHILVKEPLESMENSYLMINPKGEVVINDRGSYHRYDNCLKKRLGEIIPTLPLNADKYNSRYTLGGAV